MSKNKRTKVNVYNPADAGIHNQGIAEAIQRVDKSQAFGNLATLILIPTRGGRSLSPRAVGTWFNLMKPMNQAVSSPIFLVGQEVGAAYESAFTSTIDNPGLKDYQFILTIEDDNLPSPDGLLKLYESINGKVDGHRYDAMGGLYWTKGYGGMPMIYGDPKVLPKNFRPIPPVLEAVQPCNGLGMGFTLFRLKMFREGRIPRPWFKTEQSYQYGQGARAFTQDLYFFDQAGGLGYKFAADTRVKVGHYDVDTDTVW